MVFRRHGKKRTRQCGQRLTVSGTDHRRNAHLVQILRCPSGYIHGREDGDRSLATDALQFGAHANGLRTHGQIPIELGVDQDEPKRLCTDKSQSTGAAGGDHDVVPSMAQSPRCQGRLSRIGCDE